MKTKALFYVRAFLVWIFVTLAVIPGLFYALDVSFSLLVNLEYSPCYHLLVDSRLAFYLWMSIIACLLSATTLSIRVINKQAGNKPIRNFLLICFLFLLVFLVGFDIAFGYQRCMPKSLLFKLPTTKWLMPFTVLVGIFLFIAAYDLLEKFTYLPESGKESPENETDPAKDK